MMIRGKVESRKQIVQHKKPKVTVTEKWSYKDWKLE
jgi:nucleolar protein 53